MKLVDLETERKAKRNNKRKAAKDKDVSWKCRTSGSDGTYYKFSVRYQFKGKNWEFDIWAKSKREAELRMHNVQRFPIEINQIFDTVTM